MNEEANNQEMRNDDLEYFKEFFDKDIWPKMKSQLKEMSKKEACFVCFMAGYDLAGYSIEEEMKEAKEKLSTMSDEEIKQMLSKESDKLWEDKTKINGVWVDDKTGKILKDG